MLSRVRGTTGPRVSPDVQLMPGVFDRCVAAPVLAKALNADEPIELRQLVV